MNILSPEVYERMAQLSREINDKQNQLMNLMNGGQIPVAQVLQPGQRKPLSPEAREKIRQGQKRRWENAHKVAEGAPQGEVAATPAPVAAVGVQEVA